jgi:hypothetical protein
LLNQLFDRGQIVIENEVTAFETIPVKMFKSQNQAIINTITISATVNGQILIHDMNGNLLDQATIEEGQRVISITQPISQDDMIFGLLTDNS